MNLLWLPVAVETRFTQLEEIAQEEPAVAISMDELIEKQVGQLLDHPELGLPGRKMRTRELVVGRTPFIVVYRYLPIMRRIEILRVLRNMQTWPQK